MASAPRRLVIVESPTKAAKIADYLGTGYVVESSRGHVRDLPTSASEVPARYKGRSWARTGVNVEQDFTPLYVVSADKKATIRRLKTLLKEADELFLATDGDREGEAIAWHLLQELKPKVPVRRMVFHEITRDAIVQAVENSRQIDDDLVDAQETRRILDRLYGYEVSPVLWKKVMPKLSAGRVQSVATRLVVDRERERIAFTPASYWDLQASLDAGAEARPRLFDARLTHLDSWKIAVGRDFDDNGQLTSEALVLDEAMATQVAGALATASISVASVEARPYTRKPSAPFRTTTLQQEGGRKLGMSSDQVMRVAQQLYESGFITYMRTDSVALSSEAVQAARTQAKALYGASYLPASPRVYQSRVKNAQEAHEAIRPTGDSFRTPEQSGLGGDQLRLYTLIWQRTVASQMADAKGQTVSVKINADFAQRLRLGDQALRGAVLGASGRTITFPGFMKAYMDSSEESDQAPARIPELGVGADLDLSDVRVEGHQTRPPARYTEPSLIAKLEELEIGRPSTYASIIRTITARDYVYKRGAALVPTWLAFAVTRLLVEHFPQLVDYQFTADLEEKLDEIARGDAKRLQVLSDFFYGPEDSPESGLHEMVDNLGEIDAREISTFPVGDSGINVRVGRYGSYLEDGEGQRANIPEGLSPDELTEDKATEILATPGGAERELGIDPGSGHQIVVRNGRFGPYVTEVLEIDGSLPRSKQPKARTASLFKTMDLDTVSLDDALRLLTLPRTVGADEDGVEITAQNGRYGPYIKRGSDSRTLPSEEALFTITVDEARALLAHGPLRELGTEPGTDKALVIKDGRFGPYITDGEYNVTVPRGRDVATITLDEAVELIVAKRAKGPAPKRRTRSSATKTTAKKTTKKATSTRATATATGRAGSSAKTTKKAGSQDQ